MSREEEKAWSKGKTVRDKKASGRNSSCVGLTKKQNFDKVQQKNRTEKETVTKLQEGGGGKSLTSAGTSF